MSYVPKHGDLVWLTFDPQVGHEQPDAARRLCFRPKLTIARRACFSHAL
jgi:mRNA-degrading endonuclease toxin of MazEF toxin-antitoxin module